MIERSGNVILIFSVLVNAILAGVVGYYYLYKTPSHSPVPLSQSLHKELPLTKYAYDVMRKEQFNAEEMSFGNIISEKEDYIARMFYYTVYGKRVSGLAHIPKAAGPHPVIVMIRGYVDPAVYTSGVGTQHGAEVFAKAGYITLAPDFLGYGESDAVSAQALEDRFQTYPTVMQLLADIAKLNESLQKADISITADPDHVGIWGHSNGGQIALSVLELTGKPYPTVLWAPVSRPFPFSVLFFTDEFDDDGRTLRKIIADFEKDYDVMRYTHAYHLNWIKAPIQLHQGGADDAVPQPWSDMLAQELKSNDVDVTYYTYPASDHNLVPDWNTVMEHTLAFYEEHFQ